MRTSLSQGEACFHAFHDLLGLKGCLTSRMKVTQSIRKAHSWKSLAHPELLENHESFGKLLRVSGAGTSHGGQVECSRFNSPETVPDFFFLILFLRVHLHQLMQPQNRPAHSPVGNCASGKPEFDHNQGYVEAAMVLVGILAKRDGGPYRIQHSDLSKSGNAPPPLEMSTFCEVLGEQLGSY